MQDLESWQDSPVTGHGESPAGTCVVTLVLQKNLQFRFFRSRV